MKSFVNKTLNAGLKIALSLNNATPSLFNKYGVGKGGDISIGADLLSEEIFIEYLSEFGNIDSEESGFIDNDKEYNIVLDPLDGSDNFLSRIPYYGASVAMNNIGIIMNFCNLNAVVHYMSVNYCGNLSQDFDEFQVMKHMNIQKCGIFEGAYKNPALCEILHNNNIKYRSLGALALSLSLAHNVNFVIFNGKKRKYDLEAGYLMTKDLYRMESENLVLISKDKQLFDNISKLLF